VARVHAKLAGLFSLPQTVHCRAGGESGRRKRTSGSWACVEAPGKVLAGIIFLAFGGTLPTPSVRSTMQENRCKA